MKKSKVYMFLGVFLLCFAGFFTQASMASITGYVDQNAYATGVRIGQAITQKKPCPAYSAKLAEYKVCPLCRLFSVVLRTDQQMASKSFDLLAPGFRNALIVLMALFIAYKTLMVVSALTKQDVGKYLSELLVQSLKVLIALLFLSNSGYVYKYIVNPLADAALDVGFEIVGVEAQGDIKNNDQYLSKVSVSGLEHERIAPKLLARIYGTVVIFSYKAAEMPAIGATLMCRAKDIAWDDLGEKIAVWIEGLICYCFGWMILFACGFYLLDSVVRFGIFCTLLPFLIASWPFKVSFNYTKKGWDIFINAIFNFVMMGVVLSFGTTLMNQALTGGDTNPVEFERILNSGTTAELTGAMDIGGFKILILVACCIYAFKLVGQVGDLANSVSGTSGGTAIGSKIGGLAASGMKKGLKMAKGAGKGVARGVGGAIADTEIGKGVKKGVNAVKGRIDGIKAGIGAKNDALADKWAEKFGKAVK